MMVKYLKNPWVLLGIAVLVIVLIVAIPKIGKGNGQEDDPTDIPDSAQQVVSDDYDVKPLIDLIYDKIKGVNVFYYPEVVNKLADLADGYLITGYNYWNAKYANAMEGDTLTQALKNELHAGAYDPAIGRLESMGLM